MEVMKLYHCPACDKEIMDRELVYHHEKSTGHKFIERTLEK
jgi:hypothetical protein